MRTCIPAAGRTHPDLDLDATELLAAWEEGAALPSALRAIRLLTAGWSTTTAEEWLGATIGDRDGWLLSLREELFGHELEGVTRCPSCGESLEVEFRTEDVRAPEHGAAATVCVTADGCHVEGRLPTSADLVEIGHLAPDDARVALLDRCVQVARRDGVDIAAGALPAAVILALGHAMAEADPQTDMNFSLGCPACGHRWSTPFDILSYLWDEIDEWARRLLRDVHVLASAYGWSERDVLGMSAGRRRTYLELAGGSA